MAKLSTLDPTKETLEALRGRIVFSLSQFMTDPNGAAYVADFQALRAEWEVVNTKEMALEDDVTIGQAGVVFADRVLNTISQKVKTVIHKGKKPDLSLPLHKLFYGNQAPSDFERPILSAQLQATAKWPDLLSKATQPALQALAVPAADAVKAGQAAADKLAKAVSARDAFKHGGERDKIFAKYNALAAKAFGELKALVHDKPELELESDYAETFFQRNTQRSAGPASADQVAEEIAGLEAQVSALKQQHAELVSAEAKRAADRQKEEAAQQEAAAAKKAADEAVKAAKAAKAAAEATKKSKPKKPG